MFQSSGKAAAWDANHWVCEIVEKPKGSPEQTISINADYIILGSGTFTYPKIPNTPGIESYKGKMVHTARWNYSETGGSPADPVLHKLADKSVAIVGTGGKNWQSERATNLQIFTEQAHSLPEKLVDDGFSAMPSIAATFGGPSDVKPEDTAKHMDTLRALDDARADRIRQRTEEIVKDPETAKVRCSLVPDDHTR